MNKTLSDLSWATGESQPTDQGNRKAELRILVPIDFSPCSLKAVQCAIQVAQRQGGEILLLHVITLNLPFLSGSGVNVAKLEAELMAEAELKLSEVRNGIPRHVQCGTLVAEGVPSAEIARAVVEQRAGLLVIGKRRHSFWNFAHRHTVRHMIDKCPCEVFVVTEEPREANGRGQLRENRIQLQSL